jgi:hypothetical protein
MNRTQDELERLLGKHDIRASRWTHYTELSDQPGVVRFEFEWRRKDGGTLGYRIEVSYKRKAGPRGGQTGTTREQAARALYWHVKNLLDAVDYGIVELEEAFFPHMLGPGGATIFEEAREQLSTLDLPRLMDSNPRP